MTSPPKTSGNRIPLVSSLLVVLLCLALGGGFVWWEFRTSESNVVKLSDADLAEVQSAGQRMQYRGAAVPAPAAILNQGSPFNPNTPEANSIRSTAGLTIVYCGKVVVRVYPNTNPPRILFLQRYWGMLQEPMDQAFTITRRIAHENSVRTQLAVTPEQFARLSAMASSPPVNQAYVSALPIAPDEMARAQKAWGDYSNATHTANAAGLPKALQALFGSFTQIGNAALTKATGQYAASDKQIIGILTTRQMQAYRSGRTLTSP
jgi:hypothetical protein